MAESGPSNGHEYTMTMAHTRVARTKTLQTQKLECALQKFINQNYGATCHCFDSRPNDEREFFGH